ncbi:FtsQ-type POTRA domain-containing protein [Blochmannia endosymbiont of Polyrhachis (Hedomyrma) turneri]|uniref:FtsQ-type POTRA domain-containing protein n=1 Tax=Blochmannia endosymbiont of Polyrhachis (Hedomyrma) turneri TaxID=1505596 RepID=UPI0009E31F20|nr:FtsQ-type POTRA domain-containing protein [Blochmannia endosymbiont of Polyrhachis (Hedomyrma) turneri]
MIVFVVCRLIFWMHHTSSSVLVFKLVISGNRRYTTDDEIRNAVLRVAPMGTFITYNINLVQREIKSLPWVKQVSVRKQWPNKLKVYIIEYVPVAYWNSSHMMLTRDAVIFTIPESRMNRQSFPMLFGPVGTERDVLINYYVFLEILKFNLYTLQSAGIDNRYSWHIILENGTRLILGRKYCIERLQRFVKFYPIFLKKNMYKNNEFVHYIDLRYESGFSVKTIPNK